MTLSMQTCTGFVLNPPDPFGPGLDWQLVLYHDSRLTKLMLLQKRCPALCKILLDQAVIQELVFSFLRTTVAVSKAGCASLEL